MTVKLGDIRGNLLKVYPGTDLDLLTSYINTRYRGILACYPWTRLEATAILQTVVKYDTGTIALSVGATALTGTGTTWTAAMTGRRIRIDGRNEWYTFSYLSATTGTIDRAYEGTTLTVGTYRIWQPIYSLPSDLDVLESILVPYTHMDLDPRSQEDIDKSDPSRLIYGRPTVYSPTSDDVNNLSEVELYPGPENAEGYPIRYRKVISDLVSSEDTLLPWVDANAVFYGAHADLEIAVRDQPAKAQFWEAKASTLVQNMMREDSQRRAPQQMKMADRFTSHRWDRAGGYRSRRWWQFHLDN